MAQVAKSKRFLSIPSFTEMFGTFFLALGLVMLVPGVLAIIFTNPKEILARALTISDMGMRARATLFFPLMGLLWSYVGLGLRRHWGSAKLILFLYLLSPALHHLSTLPGAITKGTNLHTHLIASIIWSFLVYQVAKNHLVDIVLHIPGMKEKLTAAITGEEEQAKESAEAAPEAAAEAAAEAKAEAKAKEALWRQQLRQAAKKITLRELWSRYVLTFSGAALIFEVFKNLELFDKWLLANKTITVCAIFLVPALLAYAWLLTDEASKIAQAQAEAETA